MTGQQMCETIAWAHERQTGDEIDPEAIWDASPTGELWHVFALFAEACDYICALNVKRPALHEGERAE